MLTCWGLAATQLERPEEYIRMDEEIERLATANNEKLSDNDDRNEKTVHAVDSETDHREHV